MSGVRCFVGIPLDGDIACNVLAACEEIRRGDPAWEHEKWGPAANLHVTLKFLGNIAEDRMPELSAALAEAMAGCRPFELALDSFSAKPHPGRATMVWASFLDQGGACARLASAIEDASLAFGVTPERRAFHPHATLVRARKPKRIEGAALADATAKISAREAMSVCSATLFTSQLTRSIPVYTRIGTWALSGR